MILPFMSIHKWYFTTACKISVALLFINVTTCTTHKHRVKPQLFTNRVGGGVQRTGTARAESALEPEHSSQSLARSSPGLLRPRSLKRSGVMTASALSW